MKDRISFVAVREPGYSRVSIVRQGLNAAFEVDEYLSNRKTYAGRMIEIGWRLFIAWCTGRLRKSDALVVGFFAQPIFPLVRLLYRGPIISDAYFSIFDTMVHDKQKVTARSWVGRLCQWLDAGMLRHSTLCLTDTNEHAIYMREQFHADADVRTLWIGAEGKPLARRALDKHENTTFEVCFWGGFIPLQGVETIVQAAQILRDEKIRLTLIGAGQTFEDCQDQARRLGLENVDFQGWQSRETIDRCVESSHVALGIFGTTAKAARVIPNKAFEALLMGIPLITRHSPAIDELLEDGQHCLLVDAGDPLQLAKKILWARDNYQRTCEIAASGQRLFFEKCSPDQLGKQLAADVRSVVDQRRFLKIGNSPDPVVTSRAANGRLGREAASHVGLRRS
jgi:glycosyltransferase involved in cell wall biosynthesis